MQITSRTNRRGYWATVAVGAGIGVIYLIGFAAGGKPLLGLGALGIMVAFSGALLLAGRRSETVRGLIGFVGGLAYVGAVIFFRARG